MKYLSAFGAKGFISFSYSHIITIGIIITASMMLWIYRDFLSNPILRKKIPKYMAMTLITSELLLQLWYVSTGTWTLAQSLPLHLCSVAVILSPIMLITKNYSLYEILFFWSMAGTTQAILTPDLWYAFPHFIFFQYFFTHGVIILATLWMTFIEKFQPKLRSVMKAFLFTNIYAAFVLATNIALDSNYLYLMGKPEKPSLLDLLSPWPWYILQLEFVVLLSCFICYLPFAISRKINQK